MTLPSPEKLDAHGHLHAHAEISVPAAGYLVFAQASPPPFDVAVLRTYASRFFDAKLGLSAEKVGAPPAHDLAFVLVHDPHATATVPVESRPATPGDLALAERAEGAAGGGLAALAARCPRAFVVHATDYGARGALLVAAILAGTSLGPIVTLDGGAIFGVKTARERLAELR